MSDRLVGEDFLIEKLDEAMQIIAIEGGEHGVSGRHERLRRREKLLGELEAEGIHLPSIHQADRHPGPETEIEREKSEREFADPAAATEGLREAMTEVARLMGTSNRQGQAIRLWEELWTRRLPETAARAAEMAEAIDGMDRPLTMDELEELAPVLTDLAKMLGDLTSDKAPNPDLIALYYLRRLDRQVEAIAEDLNVKIAMDEDRETARREWG